MHKQHKKVERIFEKLQVKQGSKRKTDQLKRGIVHQPRLYEVPSEEDDMTGCCVEHLIMNKYKHDYVRYTDGYARWVLFVIKFHTLTLELRHSKQFVFKTLA